MPKYHLLYLNREEYLSSTSTIQDRRSLNFADMSLKWWDKKFGWYEKGCVVLSDETGAHLCYLFYKIDRYDNYLTIHNVFTPDINRRHGYAKELMLLVFNLAAEKKVKRFRLTCISNSLDFYLSLGFVYWGVNSVGDFYCDLPLPSSGLSGVKAMVLESTTLELIGKSLEIIHKKTHAHSENLTMAQTLIYNSDVIKLDASYLQESFLEAHAAS
jgi:GNAT superfamily N-acetyltransferase